MREKAEKLLADQRFITLVSIAAEERLWSLVRKDEFLKLSEQLRSTSANADEALLRNVTLGCGAEKVAYLFSSENHFIRGLRKLSQLPQYAESGVTSISATPSRFLWKLQEERVKSFEINHGSAEPLKADEKDYKELERLIVLVRLARLGSLYVVQERGGFAVSLEMDGKRYALAFIGFEEADSTLAGLAAEGTKAKLATNGVASLAENLYDSKFAGLVVNPALDTQTIISKTELSKLFAVTRIVKGEGIISRLLRAFIPHR